VLLADDNVINQKVALRLLQQMGYRADIANNGLEVLRALEQRPYDIIFMDVQMPEMDGLEASRQIRQRQQEPSPHPHFSQALTIIAMTANAMQGDREKCFEAGMDDYIPKPVRPEVLQTTLERFGHRAAGGSVVRPAAPATISSEAAILEKTAPLPLASAAPSVDLERLLEFAGGSAENFEELVDLYLNQTRKQLAEIGEAVSREDGSLASKVAHSCAGASATCGMVFIVPILRELEQCGKAGDLEELSRLFVAAEAEFERIQHFFASRAKSTAPLETLSSLL
jgi:CheY-like chemotaxis protein/HPt (histidine-containing phosphotransfer) domain-containing protein